MLQPLAHFNRCIDEVSTDYFCLFHDDDLMHPDFVQRMKQTLDSHPNVAACGCNALIEAFGKIESHTSFRAFGDIERIGSARDLARRYFSRAQNGIAPLPGYIYRRNKVGEIRFPAVGGKYSDVVWLLELTKTSSMIWVSDALITYRIHSGSDGGTESLRDRLRLLSFLKRNVGMLGADLLDDYRCSFIYKRLLSNASAHPLRKKRAEAFLKRYNWIRYANPSLYVALIRRAIIKRVSK
jgi:GT2 family glycosyltransferase